MKQKKVWRYYCDHCKKGSCGKAAMILHEKHCTMNPKRECRVCKTNRDIPTMLKDYDDATPLSDRGLKELAESVDNCPACMLSVMRQSKCYPSNWSYKQSMNEWFSEKQEQQRMQDEFSTY